jgi:hypothetical protein
MKTLWNKKTGESAQYENVDAREIMERAADIYSDRDPSLPVVLLPPLPPAPVDSLAALPADWRSQEPATLRALAATVSGRTVENKAQAVAVIEAALAKRP